MSSTKPLEFDYVIVGSGSAGSTMARRLGEDSSVRVLVIEAGPSDSCPMVRVPLSWGLVFKNRWFDWQYDTEPEPALEHRRIEFARGKVVGGSSSVNGMLYSRGHPADYNRWAEHWGLPDWSYEKVLPFFRKAETWHGPAHPDRGSAGPLHVTPASNPDPLVAAFFLATKACGWPETADYNTHPEGFGAIQATIYKGLRWNAAHAYLRPALHRRNVQLLTKALVTRVVIESGVAKGVEVIRGGKRETIFATREVLVCAGVINSPQLLMLSGVGPADNLRQHGIQVVADLPGVGANLQDHVVGEVRWLRKGQGTLHRAMRADRITVAFLRAWAGRGGVASSLPLAALGFIRSDDALALPDMFLLLGTAPLSATPYLEPFITPYPDAFGVKGVLLKPSSRGRVLLKSRDPRCAPVIEQNIFNHVGDLAAVRAALKKMRGIGQQPALAPYVVNEIAPGPSCATNAELDAYLRRTASTLHHPAGTCRMGHDADPAAVTNQRMQVRGVSRLRVVDGSSMPELVRGPIHAPIVMMAEKISSDIVESHQSLHHH